jgi:hypothetical protein
LRAADDHRQPVPPLDTIHSRARHFPPAGEADAVFEPAGQGDGGRLGGRVFQRELQDGGGQRRVGGVERNERGERLQLDVDRHFRVGVVDESERVLAAEPHARKPVAIQTPHEGLAGRLDAEREPLLQPLRRLSADFVVGRTVPGKIGFVEQVPVD